MSSPQGTLTPMMEQYLRIKRQHPQRILLYRMGDFYETFYEDAKVASRVLGIALTTRGKSQGEPVPLAGVPYHSVDTYIHRLLKAGHSVAVCDQMEDPALAKGVVKREVTEVITPGTAAIEEYLPAHQGSYCLSIQRGEKLAGYALGDISTGELLAGQDPAAVLLGVPARFKVLEVVYPEGDEDSSLMKELRQLYPELHYTPRRAWDYLPEEAEATLCRHFGVSRSTTLGLRENEGSIQRAAGGLLAYLHELKGEGLGYLGRIQFLREEETMGLDRVTVENLEIMQPLRGEDRRATLFGQLDACLTRMGSRLLARWLLAPLTLARAIDERQEAVAELLEDADLRRELGLLLRQVTDLERMVGRLAGRHTRPRDLRALADTLTLLPDFRRLLADRTSGLLAALARDLAPLDELRDLLQAALVEDPPAKLSEGGVIAAGFDAELDRLRALGSDGRSWMMALQERERQRTGIVKLKIGYNKVFGYYIELGRTHAGKVPDDYLIKQTLTTSHRYATPELKSREEEILSAEDRLERREIELFEDLRGKAYAEHAALQADARVLAAVDVLRVLAEAAERHGWCRPEMLSEPVLDIVDGRHPVVENLLAGDFIPNDLAMDAGAEQILLLTGPNMGGKSTYLRQAALIVLLAQTGSFVPAARARVGIADRIFTRVGASDSLARGQSTFLIEMEETAAILRNLSDRSLVLMDEIGRGTSTYDGLSLAWAVIEHLHKEGEPHPRTLFATHYHELTRLDRELARLVNVHVSVKEWQDEVVFLRKVERGPAERSYGIHVARLAGLPASVIERAFQLLQWIEQSTNIESRVPLGPAPAAAQMELFSRSGHPVLTAIRELDLMHLTPLEALNLLQELKSRLTDRKGEIL